MLLGIYFFCSYNNVVVKIWPGQNLTDDTRPSPFNSLRYIRALLRSSCYTCPLQNRLHFEIPSVRRLQLRTSNRSPLILTDSNTISHSSTFITCSTTQHEQLWIAADFPACNPNKLAPVITTVTTIRHAQKLQLWKSRLYPFASMPTTQSSISKPPPPMKKRIFWTLNSDPYSIQISICFTL